MAYGIIHDKAAGRARWTVEDGKILDENGTQVGTERDGVLYRMSGEVWGALEDLEHAAPEPMNPEVTNREKTDP